MSTPIFAVGDVVRLNSGSPDLTVVHTWPTPDPSDPGKNVNYVRVAWTNAFGEPQDADLPEVCFTKVISEELLNIFNAIFTDPSSEAVDVFSMPESDSEGGIGIGGGL